MAFRDIASAFDSAGTATSATGSIPAGAVDGDLLVALVILAKSSTALGALPTGWVQTIADPNPSDFSALVCTKVYATGDPAPVFPLTQADSYHILTAAYSDSTIDVGTSLIVPNTGGNSISPTANPSAAGDITAVVMTALDAGAPARTWTNGTDLTQRYEGIGGSLHAQVADVDLAGHDGSTVSETITVDGTAQDLAGFMLILNSTAVAPPGPTVATLWTGAATTDGATVKVTTSNGPTAGRLVVSTSSALTSPTYGSSVAPDANGYLELTITGLTAGTQYYYGVELDGTVDTVTQGSFRTAPSGPANFSFVFGSCQRATVGTATDAAWARARAKDPDLWFILGDYFYKDISTNSVSLFRSAHDGVVGQFPEIATTLANVPTVYTWSDHDYGADNADGTSVTKPAAQQVYRERVAHYPLEVADSIYHTFVYGRVRFIVTDERSEATAWADPDGPSKSILGATQKQWFKDTITAATEPLIIWAGDGSWMGTENPAADGFVQAVTERAELAAFLAASGKVIIRLEGDSHSMGADDGTNAPGGIAVMHAAPWSQGFGSLPAGGTYSHGKFPMSDPNPGGFVQQYGHVQITDDGQVITATFNGYDDSDTPHFNMTIGGLVEQHSGSASGTVTLAGTAAGQRVSLGSAAGTLDFTGTAIGYTPSFGVPSGHASAALSFAGSASGVRMSYGAANGVLSLVGQVAGHAPEHILIFEPPTYVVPRRIQGSLYVNVRESMSVIRRNGSLVTVQSPTGRALAGAEGADWFLGGHIYRVTSATAAELRAAGYEITDQGIE